VSCLQAHYGSVLNTTQLDYIYSSTVEFEVMYTEQLAPPNYKIKSTAIPGQKRLQMAKSKTSMLSLKTMVLRGALKKTFRRNM
jgi:hypothetical protein